MSRFNQREKSDCESRSNSVLIEYEGDNAAVGIAIALLSGIGLSLLAYVLSGLVSGRRKGSSSSPDT